MGFWARSLWVSPHPTWLLLMFLQSVLADMSTVMKNLRLMGYTRFVLPATALRTPTEVAALRLTGAHIPSTCRVEPTYIRTFDNMTVECPINDCAHVLLLDGSKHIPIAITTRTVESQKKIVKILAGITEVQIIPVAGSMKVLVN